MKDRQFHKLKKEVLKNRSSATWHRREVIILGCTLLATIAIGVFQVLILQRQSEISDIQATINKEAHDLDKKIILSGQIDMVDRKLKVKSWSKNPVILREIIFNMDRCKEEDGQGHYYTNFGPYYCTQILPNEEVTVKFDPSNCYKKAKRDSYQLIFFVEDILGDMYALKALLYHERINEPENQLFLYPGELCEGDCYRTGCAEPMGFGQNTP